MTPEQFALITQSDPDNGGRRIKTDTSVTLNPGDINIGSVEIKDADTDTRVKVKTDGVDNALVVMQNSQPLPTGAATAANQALTNTKLDAANLALADIESNTAKATSANVLAPIAASVTVVSLLAADASRKVVYVVNDSATATLYIKYGAGASLIDYTHALYPKGELIEDVFPGAAMTGIWDIASGNARITTGS